MINVLLTSGHIATAAQPCEVTWTPEVLRLGEDGNILATFARQHVVACWNDELVDLNTTLPRFRTATGDLA